MLEIVFEGAFLYNIRLKRSDIKGFGAFLKNAGHIALF